MVISIGNDIAFPLIFRAIYEVLRGGGNVLPEKQP